MRLLTLRELADLSTALEIAEFQLGNMYRNKNRLYGTKLLRRAWKTYRELKEATFAEASNESLRTQLVEMKDE